MSCVGTVYGSDLLLLLNVKCMSYEVLLQYRHHFVPTATTSLTLTAVSGTGTHDSGAPTDRYGPTQPGNAIHPHAAPHGPAAGGCSAVLLASSVVPNAVTWRSIVELMNDSFFLIS